MEYFTSDTHIGHKNILTLGEGRPFDTLEHMHETFLNNAWNVMGENDILYHLGDAAMGDFTESIKILANYPGEKYLIPGNHDKIFPHLNSETRIERFTPMYEDAGFTILPLWHTITTNIDGNNIDLLLSHMPYGSDRLERHKLDFAHPTDEGLIHICGHTHTKLRVDPMFPREINVGVDANGWAPVPMGEIIEQAREWVGRDS